MEGIEDSIRKAALRNAVKFNGKANSGAVTGKMMAEHPELRARAREILPLIRSISEEVSSLGIPGQIEELRRIDPDYFESEPSRGPRARAELPPLKGTGKGVIMRFAPGPSGPLHVGHTRAVILNDEYVKRYGGRLIIRMEDTNPEKIDPGAYDSIIEDLRWLGVEYDEVVIQSDRFDLYIDLATELVGMGHAYVCTCDVEDWRDLKLTGRKCPHRELPPAEQEREWKMMLDGTYGQNEASLVIKTDLGHKNPAVRDFVAMRINETPHPRTGDRYRAYPLYNFSVAVDDHLMGCTHVLRGKDHLNNTYRQEYVFGYFGWELPHFHHYGLISIKDTILKTSIIREGIRDGEYSGWDDMRLGTLKTMARRGIMPAAFREYWREVGTKPVDVSFSWENLYAYNKDIIDPRARRYFFVRDPMTIRIEGAGKLTGRAPLHPDRPELGERETELEARDGHPIPILVDVEDAEIIRDVLEKERTMRLRLKDLCNISVHRDEGGMVAEYAGNDLDWVRKGAKIIHWVSGDDDKRIPCRVYRPDGIDRGFVEACVSDADGDVVQFERYGFCSIDVEKGIVRANFAHR